MLFEETGKALSAGHTGYFSPDRRAYLAIEQSDGIDGESWSPRDAEGKLAWAGYAGTVKRIDGIDTVVSSLEKPRWNVRNELTARHVCADSKVDATIVLRHSARGWDWEGRERCDR